MIFLAAFVTAALAFAIALLAVPVTTRMAWRFHMVDLPGRHKAHPRPTPLLGGCAILTAILLPSLLALAVSAVWAARGIPPWLPAEMAIHVRGAASKAPQAVGILACAFALHLVGLVDDRNALGPWLKLLAQLVVCSAVVVLFGVRVLTAMGPAVSITVTVLWLAAITNAFNFLDNMDGLSAGVAAICAAALLGASASIGQLFVSGWLCVILGSLLGFLPYNFPPARVFMGDAGSLVIGFLLGVVSCLTTYTRPGHPYYLYGIFVPVVLMAVPLYDMVSVVCLRLRDRKSPMVGDRRHFSHRLVRRGMSHRSAVLTVYLCTACTATAASLLPHVDQTGAVLVFAQTLGILLIVALLESADGKGKP
jgi:UDP-GlcNAc:undecaprenyl-phosphate/decaprenyl-phosphate GlcNAc-1-phosphate transferase